MIQNLFLSNWFSVIDEKEERETSLFFLQQCLVLCRKTGSYYQQSVEIEFIALRDPALLSRSKNKCVYIVHCFYLNFMWRHKNIQWEKQNFLNPHVVGMFHNLLHICQIKPFHTTRAENTHQRHQHKSRKAFSIMMDTMEAYVTCLASCSTWI